MKNIYILPKDKPSRLRYFGSKLEIMSLIPKKSDIVFQHIYITSDEEIKEGDWCYQVELNDGKVDKCYDVTLYHTWTNNGVDKTRKFKKIILTTDPDLIQEGVQEIDDEFLEWFVKNPSCEEVETYKYIHSTENGYIILSNIIIPQEEPKQEIIASEEDAKIFVEAIKNPPAPNENLKQAFKNFSKQETIEDPDAYWLSPIKKEREWQEEKLREIFEHYPNAAPRYQYLTGLIQIALKNIASKKSLETLEAAAERMAKDFPHYSVRENMDDSDIKEWFLEALQKGAKYQAERMYSKEEVEKIVNRALTYGATASFKEWFEQFKKK